MHFIKLKSGTSVEGSEITAFKTEAREKKYIYLMAGVHGDEVEGIYVLKKLFAEIQNFESVDLPLIVLPILNVDGHRASTRLNSHGVDLNRNCPAKSWSDKVSESQYHPGSAPGSEPENKFLFKLMDKFKPAIILSFHSWKPVINYNGDCDDVANAISQINNYATVADIGYPTPGSLGDFGPEKYDSPVITFECPLLSETHGLEKIWLENKEALTSLLTGSSLLRFL